MTSFVTNPKFLAVAGVVAAAACYVSVLHPQGNKLASVHQDRVRAEHQLAQLTRSPSTKSGSAAAQIENNRKKIEVAVPAAIDLSDVLRQLDAVASKAGVRQASITPADTAGLSTGGSSAQVMVAAVGSREALDTYLQQLASLDRLFVVEQVSLQDSSQAQSAAPTQPNSAPSTDVHLQLTGRVFTSATTNTAPGGKTS